VKALALSAVCYPTQARYPLGGPLAVRVEIRNGSAHEVELLASGIPWIYHHALGFTVISGAGRDVFQNRLWVVEPPAGPDLTVPAGATTSGMVDVARYLYTPEGKSIGEVPGTYALRAHLVLLASVAGAEDFQRLELDTGPFTIVVVGQ
jgi:hypothetical protein